MRQTTADQIVAAAQALGLDVESFPEYSGRGMYGRTTAGVTVGGTGNPMGTFAAAVGQAARDSDDPDELLDDVAKVRTDAPGLDAIFY